MENERPSHNDGYLHFSILFNNNEANQWCEDDKGAGTRCEAPIELTSSDMPGLKLYLHTEISDEIEMPVPVTENSDEEIATRGQRITGEVFDYDSDPNKRITTLGIWGKVGSDVALCGNNASSFKRYDLTSIGETWSQEDGWQVKQDEQELEIETWLDGQTGTFYGIAPYPGSQSDEASGITVDVSGATPTLTYTMPAAEADHKDVLAAKVEVTKRGANNDIELQFSHILSAVKFKGTFTKTSNGTTSKGIRWHVPGDPDDKFYTLVVNRIQVKDVYAKGSCAIGAPLPEVVLKGNSGYDDYVTACSSYWTKQKAAPADADFQKGTCTITTCSSNTTATTYSSTPYYDINGDDHCLMMLPQTTPSGAKLLFECNVYEGDDLTTTPVPLVIETSLDGKTWLPGHTYTYYMTDSDLLYSFSILNSTGTSSLTSMTFPAMGGEQEFKVKSFVYHPTDDPDNPQAAFPVNWHPQYVEGGVTKYGLPAGFALYDENDDPVPDSLINSASAPGLEGSVLGKTYKIQAIMRLDANDTETNSLRNVVQNTAYDAFTKDNPYDLSTKGGTTSRNTANCYVIDGPGYFKIPLVYGNAIKNGADNKYAYTERKANSYELETPGTNQIFVNYLNNHITTPYIVDDVKDDAGTKVPSSYTKLSDAVEAAIVWQDEEDIVLENSLDVEEVTDPTFGKLGFLKFQISKNHIRPGNAIICIREKEGTEENITVNGNSNTLTNNRILWSWHIWVTDINLSADLVNIGQSIQFTQNNLGWRHPYSHDYSSASSPITITMQQNYSGNSSNVAANHAAGIVTISGSNLYYQHGRKDPMPASYKTDNGATTVDLATNIYDLGYCHDWWKYTYEGNRSILAKASVTMGRSIQHPYYLFAAQDLDWMSLSVEETTNDNQKAGYQQAGRWDPMKAGNYIHTVRISSGNYTNLINNNYYYPNSLSAYNPKSHYSHIKTIYDPCPYGFAVPPSAAYELLVYGWQTSKTPVTVNPGERYVQFSGLGGSLRFYKMGWRVHNNGGRVEHFGPPASGTNAYYGYYWTAGVCDNGVNQGWMLEIDNNDNCRPYSFCRNHTMSVRPVVDNESDATNGVIPKIIAAGYGF